MNESNKLNNLKTDMIINFIKNESSSSEDISFRQIKYNEEIIYIVYNQATTSTDLVSDFVIRSIERMSLENNSLKQKNNKQNGKQKWIDFLNNKKDKEEKKVNTLLNNIKDKIAINNVKVLDFENDDLFYYIYSGFTLIIHLGEILAVETKKNLDRSITLPISENNIRGPKDAFNENYMTNVGLIRKRIKSEHLILKEQKVGRRTKTKIGLMHINDIAKKEIVEYIEEKLKKIDIDGILDSNYIVELLEDEKNSDFPTMILTEKPDLVSYYLLQGRIALIVENTPFVIIVPAFLEDFINNIEDKYLQNTNLTFTKIVRYFALFLTILTPAFYIALITFDQESIPTDLLISFAIQRDGVPFPAFLEALLMILSFEILRETDYRAANATGNTLSIVGTLILGDAAVSAGIVSPIMIIVIAITMISGLMFSDINIVNALRTWRLVFLVFASVSGLYGIGIGTMFFVIKMCNIKSVNRPYTYPFAPIDKEEISKNFIFRKNIAKDTKRQKILTDNITKMKVNK